MDNQLLSFYREYQYQWNEYTTLPSLTDYQQHNNISSTMNIMYHQLSIYKQINQFTIKLIVCRQALIQKIVSKTSNLLTICNITTQE